MQARCFNQFRVKRAARKKGYEILLHDMRRYIRQRVLLIGKRESDTEYDKT
jgi:hypothetical protein